MAISEILPGVYVGDANAARDPSVFLTKRITRVVNCTPDLPFSFPDQAQYMRIPVADADTEQSNRIMTALLPEAIRFILYPRPSVEQGVLIHCHAGVSRSCTVAVAVLRVCCASSLRQAISLCVARRPVAFFNGTMLNFWRTLETTFWPERINDNPQFHTLADYS